MPFTAKQLKHLEARLVEERADIEGQLNDFTEVESSEDSQDQSGDLSKTPMHPADLGTDVQNEELEASVATRRSSELAEVDAALDRIRNHPDTYGIDENTGEPIPFERLDVIPWARAAVPH